MKLLDAIKIAKELDCYTAFEVRDYGDGEYDAIFKKYGWVNVCEIPFEARIMADDDTLLIKIPVVME